MPMTTRYRCSRSVRRRVESVSGSPFATGRTLLGRVQPQWRAASDGHDNANSVSVFSVASAGAMTQVAARRLRAATARAPLRSVPVGDCSQSPTSSTTPCRCSRSDRRRRRSPRRLRSVLRVGQPVATRFSCLERRRSRDHDLHRLNGTARARGRWTPRRPAPHRHGDGDAQGWAAETAKITTRSRRAVGRDSSPASGATYTRGQVVDAATAAGRASAVLGWPRAPGRSRPVADRHRTPGRTASGHRDLNRRPAHDRPSATRSYCPITGSRSPTCTPTQRAVQLRGRFPGPGRRTCSRPPGWTTTRRPRRC